MATPITSSFNTSKAQLFEIIDETIGSSDYFKKGQHKDLGLMSIDLGKDYLLYLHIVEKEKDQTELSIAPGFSFMKDRDQSKLPKDLINKLIHKLNNCIDKRN